MTRKTRYRPIYWASPTHYVGDSGTHFKDFYLRRPTLLGRFMAAAHRWMGKRDPFFHREDYA